MGVRVPKIGYFRWIICALLFLAATINYVDRQVIGLLKPTLQEEFGWSELDYGDIVFAFQLAYAIGYVIAGRLIDRLGTRLGFSAAILLWSAAAVGHAEALFVGQLAAPISAAAGFGYSTSVLGFIVMRFLLGLGESANFPAAIRTVAEWFPQRERALATGWFNSGTNIGALLTPLIVPWIAVSYGWYWAFVATGLIGFIWLALWLWLYAPVDTHPRVSETEPLHIRSGVTETVRSVSWREVLPRRQTWAFALGKFLSDPAWWLYLFWIPDFLHRNYGLDLTTMGPPLVIIYLVADIGSVGGGWLSSRFMTLGWTANRARKITMLIMALAVVPVVFASMTESLWLAVALVAVATAAHQGWSANLFTLTTDMFPRSAVGSVVGFGGMCGAIGGMAISKVTAYLLETTGSYIPVFMMAGGMYLVALGVIHVLVPRLEPARFAEGDGG